jgi:hypothetical protein
VVTLRRIPVGIEGKVSLLYYHKMPSSHIRFGDVALDDNFIVICFTKRLGHCYNEDYEECFVIEVSYVMSYVLLKEISIPLSTPSRDYKFHYFNGYFVLWRMHDKFFRSFCTSFYYSFQCRH